MCWLWQGRGKNKFNEIGPVGALDQYSKVRKRGLLIELDGYLELENILKAEGTEI